MSDPCIWDKIWKETKEDAEFRWWIQREERGERGRKVISYIEEHLGKINGLKTIEVGSGMGVYSFVLAKRGAIVSLLDYSQEALSLARKQSNSSGLTASFICADALNLDSAMREKFDVAMSFGTIEHYRYPERFLMAKAHVDLIKPGGVIIISIPNRWFFPEEILRLLLKLRNKWHLGYTRTFTRYELFRLGNKLGLKNIKVQGSAFITDMFRYFHIFQGTRLFRRFYLAHTNPLSSYDLASYFDNLLGADIFLLGCKPCRG